MTKCRVVGALLGVLAVVIPCTAEAEPLHVLILSGQNNHAWQETTPVLRQILEQGGRFVVEVTEQPQTMTPESVSHFDAILSNWNAWDNAPVKDWPEAARTALIDFVRGGKGFVSVHAGTSSFYDWSDYQELAIASWKIGETGHGKRHDFRVDFTSEDHPITHGMLPFTTSDELWHGVPIQPGARVLASAFSTKESNGSGRDEPMVMTREFGKGRSVNILLGHDTQAMGCPSFGLLLARAIEWAATNNVALPARTTEWLQDEGSLALKVNGQVLWKLNFGKDASKPYFHPVAPAGGPTLSWNAPPDHVWHHGLWFSWKFINEVNYWEEEPATGRSGGITAWDAPAIATETDGAAKVQFKLRYEPKPGETLLTEERSLILSPPDKEGGFRIDWTSEFFAQAEEVRLDRTPIEGEPDGKSWGGYAGLSMRFCDMKNPEARTETEPLAIGQDRMHADAEAVDYSGEIGGRAAGVAMLQFPGNPLSPTPWYLISAPGNAFYYFSPSLLYRAPRTMKQGEKMTLRYRIEVHDGRWSGERLSETLATLGNSTEKLRQLGEDTK